ncbi:MAG: alpha/beta fold hydrolase [Allosphingosinicella sp.]
MLRPATLLPAAMLMLGACAAASPHTAVSPAPAAAPAADRRAIDEQGFVPIGGIAQWVTIRGEDRRNPVVLFLHGGPGNPLSPYSNALYGDWTERFTIVQWDQRGAGRTFGRNPADADTLLTMDRMTRDGVEVAEYLQRHLGADRIVLVGGSWGSALGLHMVKLRPDLFRLYVGVGQLVEQGANQAASIRRLRLLADAAGDEATTAALQALGPPPWTNPRNFGILRRLTRAYEAKAVDAAPASWWVADPAYAPRAYEAEYEGGEDYSYLQFVGRDGRGLLGEVDVRALGTRFDVPIHLIQGAEDLVTTPGVARSWFDGIDAPQKSFLLLDRTGHDPNPASQAAVRRILEAHAGPDAGRQPTP